MRVQRFTLMLFCFHLPTTPDSSLATTATPHFHYVDVIMGMMASQITSLTIVYSTVYSGADQRIHQSSASLAFVRGIHRWPVNSPHKWPVTRKMFSFDDIIMSMKQYAYKSSTSHAEIISAQVKVTLESRLVYHIVPLILRNMIKPFLDPTPWA